MRHTWLRPASGQEPVTDRCVTKELLVAITTYVPTPGLAARGAVHNLRQWASCPST